MYTLSYPVYLFNVTMLYSYVGIQLQQRVFVHYTNEKVRARFRYSKKLMPVSILWIGLDRHLVIDTGLRKPVFIRN